MWPRWSTVEAIALAFFAMSDLEPGEERFSENMGDQFTNMDATRQAWAEAIEEDPAASDPHARRQQGNFDGPWATAKRAPSTSSFDDEPPF
jgi:hypothetical protein